MSNKLLDFIRKRDRIFRLWEGDSSNCRHRELYKTLRNRVSNLVMTKKDSFYRKIFEKNKNNTKNIWENVDGLLNQSKKSSIDYSD